MIQIKELLTGDDAVSPVIGVILMVAITVILAAVIAAFVLGLGDSGESAPQVSFDYGYNENSGNLSVTVQSGDVFDAGNIEVSVEETSEPLASFTGFSNTTGVRAGDGFIIDNSSDSPGKVEAGNRVDIIFTPEEGGESSIIGTFNAPEREN